MRGLVLSDHQGDMLPHLISPDSALTEVSSSWKESSPSSSQVHESTTPFSQNPEALGELCAAQAGHTTAYKGEGESCLLHSNLHNGLGCSNEGVLEAKPRYSARYTSDGADASPPSTAIMPISWQSTVRPEANSIIPDSPGTSELQGITSSFDHNEQHEKAQFHRTRAFSHGDLKTTESLTELSSNDRRISATHVTGSASRESSSPETRETRLSHPDLTFAPVDLRPDKTGHAPEGEQRNDKSEATKSTPLNESEPRSMAPTRRQMNSPTVLSNARAPPTDDTRSTQRINDKGPANREAKLHATLKRATNPRQFFVFGKVFLALRVEPTGEMQSNNGSNLTVGSGISTVAFGERVFSKIRRFVVIREGERSCTALQIMTYGGLGVAKKGVQKCEHAIIYSGKQAPEPEPKERAKRGELGLLPRAIRVAVNDGMEKLDSMSRLDFGEVYTIPHSARVRGIGMVHKKSSEPFLYQFKSVFEKHGSDGRYALSSSTEFSNVAHEESRRVPRQQTGVRPQNAQYAYDPSRSSMGSVLRDLPVALDRDLGRALYMDAISDGDRSEDIETVRPNRAFRDIEPSKVSGSVSTASSSVPMHARLPGYRRHKDRWFRRYRMIQVLLNDNTDVFATSECNGDAPSETESQKPCEIGREVKAFVVIGGTTHHSLCVPVIDARACSSSDHPVNPEHRAVLYTMDDPDHAWPPKEPDAMRSAIKVRFHSSQIALETLSRLDYSRIHTIGHSNRVKAFGWIHSTSHSAFDYDQDYVYRLVTYRNPDTASDTDDSDDSDYHSLDNDDESNAIDERIVL